jgi:preprotein translocase subunit SecE
VSGTWNGQYMKIGKYIGEVRSELKKATWPWDPKEKGLKKYKQLIDSTVVVIIAMVLLGAYVATIDFSLQQFMEFLTTGF